MAFDPSNIQNSTKIRNAPSNLQSNWLAIRGEDGTYDPYVINVQDRTPLVPGTVSAVDPSALSSPNAMRMYCKQDADGNQQLYVIDPSSQITQLTGQNTNLPGGGYPLNGETSLVGGLLLKWARTPNMAADSTVAFEWAGTGSNQLNLTAFPNNVFNIQITMIIVSGTSGRPGQIAAYDKNGFSVRNGNATRQFFVLAIGN